MKIKFIFLFLFFFNFNLLHSANNIVYMNMNKIMSTSKPGLSLMQQFEKIDQKNNKIYNENIIQLKKKDEKLLTQKNIISKLEFQKKIGELKNEIYLHNQTHKSNIENFNKMKIKYTNILLKKINPILIKYSDENEISLILKKKDLIIGKSNLDITGEIIKLINDQIKEIEIK